MGLKNHPRGILVGLLISCALAGAIIVIIGLYGKPLRTSKGSGKWTLPLGQLAVAPPSFTDQRQAFAPDVCYDSYEVIWSSGTDGQIYANGELFLVKGISWFGVEGHGYTFTGLNYTTIDTVLDWVTQQRYNTLRIPFSAAFALADPERTRPRPEYVKRELKGRTAWEILDLVVEKAAVRGLAVILDLHFLEPLKVTELWYDDKYSEKDVMEAWARVLTRYGGKWNLMAIDVKNEPNGKASWGLGQPATDVNSFYERAIANISAEFPEYRGLFFVEGVQFTDPLALSDGGGYPYWWGGNFEGAKKFPIAVRGVDNRIVYSPHVYGPAVHDHPYFQGDGYEQRLPQVWDEQMGWLVPTLKKGVVIGEWGGSLLGKDKVVLELLAAYLADKCLQNTIWWAINPESGDTAGVMAWNWRSYDGSKVALVTEIMPDPSAFGIVRSKLCYHRGGPNSACVGTEGKHKAVEQGGGTVDKEHGALRSLAAKLR